MGLFTRVSDIVSANLNEMAERFENPEKMLRQAVREMETAIGNAMDGAAKVIANEKLLRKQLDDQNAQCDLWHERAKSAVVGGNDTDARTALLRKKEHEQLIAALAEHLASAETSSQSLRRQIDAMRAKMNEAKRKLVVVTARKQAADARRKLVRDTGGVKLNNDAFQKFDRMCERVDQAEAETEALLELADNGGLDEPIHVATDLDVETELQELKASNR